MAALRWSCSSASERRTTSAADGTLLTYAYRGHDAVVTPFRQSDHALSRSRGLEAIAPERRRALLQRHSFPREAAARSPTEAVARRVTRASRGSACGSSGRCSRPPRTGRQLSAWQRTRRPRSAGNGVSSPSGSSGVGGQMPNGIVVRRALCRGGGGERGWMLGAEPRQNRRESSGGVWQRVQCVDERRDGTDRRPDWGASDEACII